MAADQTSNYNRRSESDALEQQGRVPPQATEVEEAVLGAMLIEHEAATVALQMLKPNDFYKQSHRHIFEVLHDLYEKDNPLDLLTVENELRDRGLLDACGGTGYLSELTRSVSSAANIDYHAQIISEKATKRNLILGCTDIIKEAYDSSTDPYDVLDRAEQRIFDLANQKHRAQAKPIGDVLKDTLSYLEDIRGKPAGVTGVPTGLDVDKLTAGWQNGDMIIVAARPSMGKTAFVLTTARNAALHQDPNLQTKVAIFSLEMSNQSLVQRLLTMEARINAQSARSGRLKDDEFKRLIDAAGRLFTANIFVDDTPGLSIMELRTKSRRLKSEHDIGLIVVDYLQLMSGGGKDFGTREQEIASISRGLKALAKDLNVPVVALSQLSRAVEQRGGDKRPQLSDLRESGCLRGDTLIPMADTGEQLPIRELVGSRDRYVWALDEQRKKIVKAKVINAFSTGTKPYYELTTQLGRTIHATGNHKFLTIDGWKRLDEIEESEHIALPRGITSDFSQTMDDRDVLPKEIWDMYVKPAMKKGKVTHRALHERLVMSYSGMTIFKQNVGRLRARRVAKVVNSIELEALADSDIYWDRVSSMEPEGTAEVYDLTIENHHNFLANDIIVHNSIEQDADVVTFLYRPEYYGIKTTPEGQSTKGMAELIVGKQRNGPTGTIPLYFVEEYARFENLTTAQPDPFAGGDGGSRGDSGGGSPPMGHDPGGPADQDGDEGDGEAPF